MIPPMWRPVTIAALAFAPACSGKDSGGAAGDAGLSSPAADIRHQEPYDVDVTLFPVGVTGLELVDPDRDDGRPLPTEVWYPAAAAATELPLERFVGTSTPAHRDAPAAADRGPFPLLVFSHGNQGIRVQSTFFTVRLASRGYVVAAMDHTGNTLVGDDERDVAAANRPADVAFVTREVVRRSLDGGGRLAGLVDPERVGVTGHSFGAWTALAAPLLHDGFSAAVALAPPGPDHYEPPRPLAGLAVPLLIVAATQDGTTPFTEAEEVYAAVSGPRYLAGVQGAGHFSFTDLCGVWADDYIMSDGCSEDFTPAPEVHRITNRLAVPFLDRYVRGDPRAADALVPESVRHDLGEEVSYRADPRAPP